MRVKLSYHLDRIDDYDQKGKKQDKHCDITKQVEKANNNENVKQKQKQKQKVKAKVNNKEKKEKFNTNKTEKEEKDENERGKKIVDPKQNESPLKSIVVYHGTNQGGDMESNKGCQNIE